MSQFSISTRIFWGRDGNDQAQKFLSDKGHANVSFIIDNSISSLEAVKKLQEEYTSAGFTISHLSAFDASFEPSYAKLDEYTEEFRDKQIDLIVAIGGGSVLDVAKGVGILLKNPGKAIEYRGMNKVKNPGIAVVCYPTTAGTGSEVTHTASFIDTDSNTKLGINGLNVTPLCGVLIPELTFSCPKKVTIYAGLDAMLHAVEAVTAKTSSDITNMIGSHAFALLFSNFKKALDEPTNYDAREKMLLGSYYAGIAMMNAGGGPASGISYPLGVHFKVPHGIAGGIFLRHVFEYNVSKNYHGYIPIYDQLPGSDLTLSSAKKSTAFVEQFNQFYASIDAPEELSSYGVFRKDVELLTEFTMKQRIDNLNLNPVAFGREDVVDLLNKVTK